jgi:dTDP-4-dehydrorhamnose reductase
LRMEGIPLRAVTAWALFGAMDWDSMLRRHDEHYEAGAWDITSGQHRPTMLVQALQSLANHGRFVSPVLSEPGWWRREDRLHGNLRLPQKSGIAMARRIRAE